MKRFFPFSWISYSVSILIVIVFAFANQSCRENLDGTTSPTKNIIDQTGKTEVKILSYDQFLQQVKGFKDKEMYEHFKMHPEEKLHNNGKIPIPFPILPSTRDSVRKITMNDHTTYTIPVYRRNHTGLVFRNIIIDSTNTGIRAYLAWYFPDKNWIKEYKQDRKRIFYGDVIMSNYDDLPSSVKPAARVNLVPVCVSVMVLSSITEHLCCHNSQHASCGCPAGSKYYFEFQYSNVTTCIDASISSSGGFPGGTGGSGGGGTVPNPGGGYDPCPQPKSGTSKTPCTPSTPDPGPVVVPNAAASLLVSTAKANGINFTYAQIAVLNEMNLPMITRIKDLIAYFKKSVKDDYSTLLTTLTGRALTPKEIKALDALGDNDENYKFIMRLIYAANAYLAQTYTAAKYNALGATCSNCKANAFKHALFLIYNAESFTKKYAETLAGAHEEGQAGVDTEMDKKNNAAGSSIFSKFNGTGKPIEWVDRVKAAADQGQYGLVFVKNSALVSTTNVDPTCP